MNRIDVEEFSREDLQKAMAEASNERITSFADINERIIHRLNNPRHEAGFTLPWGKAAPLVRLREKEVSLFAGLAGHRKTTLCSQILLFLMTQTKVGIASFEMDLEDLAEIMVYQAAGSGSCPSDKFITEFSNYSDQRLYGFDYRGTVPPLMALGIVRAFAEAGCKVVCLDSLMMCGINNDLDAEREFVVALTGLARMLDIHIMLVHHALEKRNEGEHQIPQRHTIRGNGAIVDLSSTIFLVWFNKKKSNLIAQRDMYGEALTIEEQEYVDTHACQKLIVAKQRYGSFEGTINLCSHPSRQMLSARGQRSVSMEFAHGD